MGAEWLSAALPYIGGGVLGSAVTYGLTWVREHRRTVDSYRAPQRQAIGDILAAAHELQLRVHNWRRVLTDLIEEIRQDRTDNLPAINAQIRETESAYAAALLEMRRAFEVGSLTVVDVRCWQEMAVAASAFSRFDDRPYIETMEWSADAAEQFVNRIGEHAEQLRIAMSGLVRTANERVTPADTRRNRGKRLVAQRQLTEYLRGDSDQTPEGRPDP